MEVTYENIKSMIVSQEQDGMMIKLKFQAEGQELPIDTVAVVTVDPEEVKKNVMKQVAKAAAVNVGIGMASKALGTAVGGIGGQAVNAAGSAAQSATSTNLMSMDKIMKTEQNDEKTQEAIVTAFGHLSMYYKWEGGKWVYSIPGV